MCLVSSVEAALTLSKYLQYLSTCEMARCTQAAEKGICIGKKIVKFVPIGKEEGYEIFLQKYWMNRCLMTNENNYKFVNKIFMLRVVVVNKILYRPGDHVVVQTDGDHQTA